MAIKALGMDDVRELRKEHNKNIDKFY